MSEFTPEELKDLNLTAEELAALSGAEASDARGAAPEETGAPAPIIPPAGGFGFIPEYRGPSLPEIETKLTELDSQLEEGDIDIIQYTKQRDPLIQQRIESGMALRAQDQMWKAEQDAFFASNPGYRNPALNGALARVFKLLDTQENAHKTGLQLLNEAKGQVEREARELRESVSTGSGRGSGGPADFDRLDRLEGAELERALEKLSPEQVERYLRG
jgi:hypothetical protein